MPTPDATVSTFLQVRARINYRDGGWNETYDTLFGAGDQLNCAAKWNYILGCRARLLPYGFSIARATISDMAVMGDGYPLAPVITANSIKAADSGFPATLATQVCNDTSAAMLFRFDTGLGKFSNRWLRGLWDELVSDNAKTITIATVNKPPGNWVSPYYTNKLPIGGNADQVLIAGVPIPYSFGTNVAGSQDWTSGSTYTTDFSSFTLINAFMSIIRDHTALYVKVGDLFDQYRFGSAARPAANWYYRRISSRIAGKRFALHNAKRPVMA